MKFILGKKEYMTQVFDESGKVVPGTVISAGPVYVTAVKKGKVQVGFGQKNLKKVNKPQRALAKAGADENKAFATLKEFSVDSEMKFGDKIDASVFAEGDKVVVSAVSKGKGFQGVVKRHGFKGGRRSHGQKHSEREPGSIGAGGKQRVMPGMRMAGRMGGDRITLKGLTVARVEADKNLILIKGAVPGRKGTLVEIIAQ